MKAITLTAFGGPENMRFEQVSAPQPGEGQVLIEVFATSVNRPDIVQRQGNYPPPPGDSPILGLEVAGIVTEVASDVSSFAPGDRVIALVGGGGYAEYAVAHAEHCMPLPDHLEFSVGACLCETYITAYLNIFQLGEFSNGQSILIHGGGGGVNTAAIQLCKTLLPDNTVFVTASTGKVAGVEALGADHVIDYKQADFAEAVRDTTKKRGVDLILDHIGAAYLQQNMRCLSIGGRLVVIGVTGGVKETLNLATMMVKRQSIVGSVLRSRPKGEKAEIIRQFNATVMPLVSEGRIKPLIHTVIPLENAMEAHQLMESSAHFGKIVLAVK